MSVWQAQGLEFKLQYCQTTKQNKKRTQKLNSKRTNNPTNKWANELNRKFSEEEMQIANKYMNRCSLSFTLKKIQIKTTLRFHLTTHWQSSRKQTTNAGKDMGKRNPLIVGGNVN
jgi:uncharacterized caspase-like protein